MNYSRIKELSRLNKLPLKKLAESIEMTETGLYSAFRNNTLKIRDLERISKILNVNVSFFFDSDVELEAAAKDIDQVYLDHFRDLELENKELRRRQNEGMASLEILMTTVDFCGNNSNIYRNILHNKITIETLENMWSKIFERGDVKPNHIGIVSDYRNGYLDFEEKEGSVFVKQFRSKYNEILKGKKIALVLNEKDLKDHYYFTTHSHKFKRKLFSSIIDAYQWILRK